MLKGTSCDIEVGFYGVFDGHAGARAALHCAEFMHATFASKYLAGAVA